VHAGLAAQVAEGMVALDLDGGAADAGHVALGLFQHLGLEALALAVFEVLAQQHAGPVAGLGAAGAGLDVDEAVQRIGRVAEHAAEFQLLDRLAQRMRLGLDRGQAVEIALGLAHLVELGVVGQVARQVVDGLHHRLEALLLLAQLLRALGLVPDGGVFQRGVDFVQPQGFAVVVKDTPGAAGCGRSDRRAARRSS
jgi:hypothetical protein